MIHDPFDDKRTAADTTVKILALLNNNRFRNLNQIQDVRISGTWPLKRDRLHKFLEQLKDDKLLEHWEDLDKKKQDEYKLRDVSFDPKSAKHIYKITELGQKKFKKVRDSCLDDPVIQRILRARVEEPNN